MTKALSLTLKIALGSFFLILLVQSTPVNASYVLDDDLEAYNSMPFFFSGTDFYAINQAYGSITTSFGYSGTHSIQHNATFSIDTIGRDFAQSTTIGHVRVKLYVTTIEPTGSYDSSDSLFQIGLQGTSNDPEFRVYNFGRTYCQYCDVQNNAHDDVVLQAGWNDLLVSWNGNNFAFSVNGHSVTGTTPLGQIQTIVFGSYPASQGQTYLDNIQISGDDDSFEFDFETGGETTTGTVPERYVTIVRPEYGTTTASTTVTTEINFRTPFSIDFRPTTTRSYIISDAVTGEIEYNYSVERPPNISENVTISENLVLPEGSKILRAGYFDQTGRAYGELSETFFSVATNTYFIATGLNSPRDTTGTQTQIDCTLFDIGCQFQKAIQFLFYPSEGILDKFQNTWQTIKNKKPIGYITVTIDQLKNLDASGSQNFDLGTVPFMNEIFTPFRTAVAGILWALYAIFFYLYRLKHLEI